MNKLIESNASGNWNVKGILWENLKAGQVITKEIYEKLYGCLYKLKHYEDTGLSPEQVEEINTILIDYILNNIHWCPFKDETDIDFEKECVGFRENGCKECIYRNIDKLNFYKEN